MVAHSRVRCVLGRAALAKTAQATAQAQPVERGLPKRERGVVGLAPGGDPHRVAPLQDLGVCPGRLPGGKGSCHQGVSKSLLRPLRPMPLTNTDPPEPRRRVPLLWGGRGAF